MRIILFRHGPAGERDPMRWPDDRERPLSPKGIERTRRCAEGIVRMEGGLSQVVTSPYFRATQTAMLLSEAGGLTAPLELASLEPGGSWRETLGSLAHAEPGGTVALVGHEPDLGKFAGVLLFGAPAALALKKAGACSIEFDEAPRAGSGRLRWFLPPRALRRFSRSRSHV